MSGDLEARMTEFQRCIEARDETGAGDILDSEFALVLVQPARAVVPRGAWLTTLKDYVVHAYAVDEQILDVDGDCAAVVQRVQMTATMLGQDRSGVFIISDVWRKRDGHWRVWRRHSTPLTAGAMHEA